MEDAIPEITEIVRFVTPVDFSTELRNQALIAAAAATVSVAVTWGAQLLLQKAERRAENRRIAKIAETESE